MARSRFVPAAALAATVLALSGVSGCGGDDTTAAEVPGILPPKAGPAKACTGTDVVLAVSEAKA